jgi:RimJ/RimL family protein N-acetyltransferase
MLFSTPRLVVREWEAGSGPALVLTLLSDPVVSAKLPWQDITTLERAEAWVKRKDGGNTFPIFTADEAEETFVGFVGVVDTLEGIPTSCLEVGYVLSAVYWGRGLATELVAGLLDYLWRSHPGLRSVLAYTDAQNTGSQRVLQKNGFCAVQGTVLHRNVDRMRYEVQRTPSK